MQKMAQPGHTATQWTTGYQPNVLSTANVIAGILKTRSTPEYETTAPAQPPPTANRTGIEPYATTLLMSVKHQGTRKSNY